MPKQSNGWIKLYRQMTDWCWYKDLNTKAVFLHLLLMANASEEPLFIRGGEKVLRGQVAITTRQIAEAVGITYDQSRTALLHLKSTRDITITRHASILIISIVNFDRFQSKSQSKSHLPSQSPSQSPLYNNRRKKGNGENGSSPSPHPQKNRPERDANGVKILYWDDFEVDDE